MKIIYMCVYIYTYMCVPIYIHIYIYKSYIWDYTKSRVLCEYYFLNSNIMLTLV